MLMGLCAYLINMSLIVVVILTISTSFNFNKSSIAQNQERIHCLFLNERAANVEIANLLSNLLWPGESSLEIGSSRSPNALVCLYSPLVFWYGPVFIPFNLVLIRQQVQICPSRFHWRLKKDLQFGCFVSGL